MRALITGGAGFVGSHLAEELLDRGYEVDIIDDLSTGSFDNVEHLKHHKNFSYHIGTIMKEKFVDGLISKNDIVFHLAAAVGVKYIIDNPIKSIEINIKGTEIVLEKANKYKRKVLLTSTSEIYGKNEKTPFKEEDDRILGSTHLTRWSYSCTKAVDEFLALAYFREKKLPVVIVRLFNTVGPRQTGRYGMVIPRLIQQALQNKPITIYGDGRQTRSFGYVKDVVSAMADLVEKRDSYGKIFNIGNPEGVTINELAKRIKKMTNSKSKIIHIPFEKAYEKGFEDMRHRVPDITKLKRHIGFRPKTGLNEILRNTIAYFQS